MGWCGRPMTWTDQVPTKVNDDEFPGLRKPVTASRTSLSPRTRRRVRITLTLDEWAILGALARKYRKPLGSWFQVAAHPFLEPMPRLMSTPGVVESLRKTVTPLLVWSDRTTLV